MAPRIPPHSRQASCSLTLPSCLPGSTHQTLWLANPDVVPASQRLLSSISSTAFSKPNPSPWYWSQLASPISKVSFFSHHVHTLCVPCLSLPPHPTLPASAVCLTSLVQHLPGPPMAMLLKPADLFVSHPSWLLWSLTTWTPSPCNSLSHCLWGATLSWFALDIVAISPLVFHGCTPESPSQARACFPPLTTVCLVSPVPALSPRRAPRFLSPTHLSSASQSLVMSTCMSQGLLKPACSELTSYTPRSLSLYRLLRTWTQHKPRSANHS